MGKLSSIYFLLPCLLGHKLGYRVTISLYLFKATIL
jgi:hypothetical protein